MATATNARARIAALSRSRQPDDPALIDARRDLAEASIRDYVTRTVAAAPQLTTEQRDRLASLLRGSA